jgi:hypothetical protein
MRNYLDPDGHRFEQPPVGEKRPFVGGILTQIKKLSYFLAILSVSWPLRRIEDKPAGMQARTIYCGAGPGPSTQIGDPSDAYLQVIGTAFPEDGTVPV